ncbi:MAG: 1-(5-phosphoribosyl)-5-[(5-phosphoribosylamino)methylideneamino]imidazole-4-carboxamide isomerase [Oscillospiraceae bacterium]|jgi:phosphoribosylformimino-5-aminoimidazole carboxamide ribotide isomerase|nr:1-(5-phosphoribosyl)-5-[(5-phosphoribosylamino)methylideneamino]imidazole-4-carboxamide isomerase [Oscillospiraceae bacterium]
MDIYPAIDLRGGRVVRLFQGDYDKMTVYSDSPLDAARSFQNAGASFLHMVDLDGAKDGTTPNFEAVRRIAAESGLKVEIGGGVRSLETIKKYVDAGVFRVIIGTAAVTQPELLSAALQLYGEKIAVGVDLRDGEVAIHGWTRGSGRDCFEFCAELEKKGVKTVICTDISRDGAMTGPNVGLYRRLSEGFRMDFIASGGVSELADISALRETGVSGAIVGKALYTGKINIQQALKEAL